jgi:hypothetical protein
LVKGLVKKFSVKDETIRLANGDLACKHCHRVFRVVAQAFRHFKDMHSKVMPKAAPVKLPKMRPNPKPIVLKKLKKEPKQEPGGDDVSAEADMINAKFFMPEVNLILKDSPGDECEPQLITPRLGEDHFVETKVAPRVCSYCKMKFETLELAYSHIEESHRDMLKLVCLLCNAKFARPNDMLQHKRSMHPSNNDSFADMLIKEDDRLLCKVCLKCFQQPGKVRLHFRKEHPELIEDRKCGTCKGPGLTCKHGLRMKAATGWMCARCGKPFHSQEQLDIHVLVSVVP